MAQSSSLNHDLELAEVASRHARVSEYVVDLFNGDLRVCFSVDRLEDQTLGASAAELHEFVGRLDVSGDLLFQTQLL